MTGDVELQVILDIDAKGVIRGTVFSIMGRAGAVRQAWYNCTGDVVQLSTVPSTQCTWLMVTDDGSLVDSTKEVQYYLLQ